MARLKNTINEFGDESGSIGERQEKKKREIAQNISGMPDHVYDSIKRQYSGKDYTIEAVSYTHLTLPTKRIV